MKKLSVVAVGVLAIAGPVLAGATSASAHKPPVTTVTAVSPQHGPVGGGTFVVIQGKNLVGATDVEFGSTPAASFYLDGNKIVATSPSGTVGPVDITVTTSLGTSALNPPKDQFSYVTGPAIEKVTPGRGADTGGTKVTIAGNDFGSASAVEFGGVSVPFTIDSSQALTVVTRDPSP